MRRLRMAGPALAGACAVALTVSLAACSPVSKPAASPFATIFPSRGTAPVPPGGPARAHATGVDSGGAAGINGADRDGIRAARLLRTALADPDAIAAAGSGVWVANSADESGSRGWISEFSATSGALIRVIAGPRYGLTDPQALAVGSGGIWVANGGSDSVTEINAATGALIRVISSQRYQLSTTVYAPAIAVAGDHVWVPDASTDSVTEINAATGALIRVISGPEYQLNGPDAIAAAGDGVWVIDVNSASVTEIDAGTGALIRVIRSVTNVPFAITADRGGVWLMTNLGVKAVDGARPDGAVDEFSAASGRLITRIAAPPFRSGNPGGAITSDGAQVWATDTSFYSYRGWVAELSPRTGALVRVIGAKSGHVERS